MAEARIPEVIVDFIFESGLFHIAIINIGDAAAYKISVTFNREIKGLGGSKAVSKMALFQNIEFMPPQKRIATFLDTSTSYFRQQQPTDIEATIRFSDSQGKSYKNIIKHNLNIYRDIGFITS